MDSLQEVCEKVLALINPSKEEVDKVGALVEALKAKASEEALKLGFEADPQVYGSFAKGTWLSGEADIDLFLRVPAHVTRQEMAEKSLKIGEAVVEALGGHWIKRFAEHPYVEGWIEGIRVNIVPCFRVERGLWLSAADRSPFHTEYVMARLKEDGKSQVRLLKRFMKGIGVYGADIKTGGFSGYLCELLILRYGGFKEVLEAARSWRRGFIIDLEGYYEGRKDDARKIFPEPLIVVDPVDEGRNVASAVRPNRLGEFMAAAGLFLDRPSMRFFYPPPRIRLTSDEFSSTLSKRGTCWILILFAPLEVVPDVLWGQMYSSLRAISRFLRNQGFNVLREAAWSDEGRLNAFLVELDRRTLPKARLHLGPPVTSKESHAFLAKYLKNEDTISGPWIHGNRWVVLLKRKRIDAVELIREVFKTKASIGIRSKIAEAMDRHLEILTDGEITKAYSRSEGLATFLMDFLVGRPPWLWED
ncbi:MAG: CCA tRNA nucleotidyltransferase [Candidatus Bathyarchaeia archaeon]